MKIEKKIVNVIFYAQLKKTVVESREAVCGEPFGILPTPTRSGYEFDGWYLPDGTAVNEDTVLESEEDVSLVAHWTKSSEKKKRSMLRRQKLAIAVLSAISVFLIVALLVVNHVVTIYPLSDVYVKDGVEYTDRYYVKKKNGSYALYDKKGNRMEVNSDGYYIAAQSGNQYQINSETGEWSRYAVVDYGEGELLGYSDRIMMYPQISQTNTHSIVVTDTDGSVKYKFYRDSTGKVKIEGYEDANVSYDQTLFASLCVSCGYTITMQKLDLSPDYVAPRLPDGSLDYSAYGLADVYDENGNRIYTPVTYTVVQASYASDGTCSASDVQYTVKVGDAILSGAGYYVQLVGRDAVYIVSSSIEETVLRQLEDLVTPMVTYPMKTATYLMVQDFWLAKYNGNFANDFVEKLKTIGQLAEEERQAALTSFMNEFKAATDEIVAFTYQDLESRSNSLVQSRPYVSYTELMKGYYLNNDSVSAALGSFFDMQFIACRELGLSDVDWAKYGFDKDVHVIFVDMPMSDENNSIYGYVSTPMFISPKTENGTYYIASMWCDMIVEVDQFYLTFLEWERSTWYDQYFFLHNFGYATDFKLEVGGKTYTFKLDNTYTYSYYEDANGKIKKIDLSTGKLQEGENGVMLYVDQSGRKYTVKSFNFREGDLRIKIVDQKTGRITYEPYEKYLITVDRDGYSQLEISYQSDGKEINVKYDLGNLLSPQKTYSLVYQAPDGSDYSVVGTYSSGDGNTYQDYYRLTYWQEVKSSDGSNSYVWEKVAPLNTSSTFILRDSSGKIFEATVSTDNLKVYCEEYQGGTEHPNLLDYTIHYEYATDTGTTKTHSITGYENFREIYGSMIWYSIEGDVDVKSDIEGVWNMTLEQFIAEKTPIMTFTYTVSDMAYLFNLESVTNYNGVVGNSGPAPQQKVWYESNTMEAVVRLYQYSPNKALLTIEVIEDYDENGNPIFHKENEQGSFYVLSSYVEMISNQLELLLAGKPIAPKGEPLQSNS